MYLFTEVIFYSGQRKYLPKNGYRPDAIFNETIKMLADHLKAGDKH